MEFKNHKILKGTHATFSPSQSSWLRYDDWKFADKLFNNYRSALGTEIHDFAASQIVLAHRYGKNHRYLKDAIETYIYRKYYDDDLDILKDQGVNLLKHLPTLNEEVFDTLTNYISDSVSYKMTPEQPLFYSEFFYGTADAIRFDEKEQKLMIFDLKTGVTPAHMDQLEVYAAMFCLEYTKQPTDIDIELRLYQNGDIAFGAPETGKVFDIMNIMVDQTNKLRELVK